MVLVAAPSGDGPVTLSGCGDLQRLQRLGEEIRATKVALSTTHDAVTRLREGYKQFLLAGGHPVINEHEDDIYHQLTEHLREIEWLLQQTNGLQQKLHDTRETVSILQSSLRTRY